MTQSFKIHLLIRVAAVLSFFAASAAQSQIFTIDYFVLSGGGGASSNAEFSVTGVIGQADAGPRLAGGPFSLDAGFSSVTAASIPAIRPVLSINKSGPTVTLLWSSMSAGFVLERTASLVLPISWQPAPAPEIVGSNNTVILTSPQSTMFFRLRRE
jgi:hypothetical protein